MNEADRIHAWQIHYLTPEGREHTITANTDTQAANIFIMTAIAAKLPHADELDAFNLTHVLMFTDLSIDGMRIYPNLYITHCFL